VTGTPINCPILPGGRLPWCRAENELQLTQDLFMSTYMPKPGEVAANWHVVDASGQILGRLAARIAMILQGKHKPTYTPHVDTGDFVIVLNADKVKVTGRKADVLNYETYSRYPGGHHYYSYKRMNALHPEKVVELAVRRMLPKSKMGRNILGKLKIYRGGEHPHSAQQPQSLDLSRMR
jgi:large subunit ribosomal protein L13